MKGLKKLFLASMVAVAGLSLASCGKKENKTTEPTGDTTESTTGKVVETLSVLDQLKKISGIAGEMKDFTISDSAFKNIPDFIAGKNILEFNVNMDSKDYNGSTVKSNTVGEISLSDSIQGYVTNFNERKYDSDYTDYNDNYMAIDGIGNIVNYREYSYKKTKPEIPDEKTWSKADLRQVPTELLMVEKMLYGGESKAISSFSTIENYKKLAEDAINFGKGVVNPLFERYVDIDKTEAKTVYNLNFDKLLTDLGYDKTKNSFETIGIIETANKIYGEKTIDDLFTELDLLYNGKSTKYAYLNDLSKVYLPMWLSIAHMDSIDDLKAMLESTPTKMPKEAMILSLVDFSVTVEDKKTTFDLALPNQKNPEKLDKYSLAVDYSKAETISCVVESEFGKFFADINATETGITFEAGTMTTDMKTTAAKIILDVDLAKKELDLTATVIAVAEISAKFALTSDSLDLSLDVKRYANVTNIQNLFDLDASIKKDSIKGDLFINSKVPSDKKYDSTIGSKTDFEFSFGKEYKLAEQVKAKTDSFLPLVLEDYCDYDYNSVEYDNENNQFISEGYFEYDDYLTFNDIGFDYTVGSTIPDLIELDYVNEVSIDNNYGRIYFDYTIASLENATIEFDFNLAGQDYTAKFENGEFTYYDGSNNIVASPFSEEFEDGLFEAVIKDFKIEFISNISLR